MSGTTVGRSVDMFEAKARVTGTVGYALNAEVPGMVFAKLLRSTVPHARIRSVDVSAAEKMPGVVAVLTAADLDQPGGPAGHHGPVIRDQPVLCRDKVRFVGDPVAAVAAETEEAAAAALHMIEVEYEELPFVTTVDEALAEGAEQVHDAPPPPRERSYSDINLVGREGNICTKFQLRTGDLEAGFAAADLIMENVYESPAVQHVPMEPHVVIASFKDGRLHVISSTQAPFAVRDSLSEMFGLPASDVRVTVPPLGGGYGAKTYAKFEPVTAALAWKAKRPAELVKADHRQVYRLPDAMPFADAAAISLAFDTAWMALRERARIQPGESVLVLGAGGAVGGAAVQLAKAMGAGLVLAGTSSPDGSAAVRAAGADGVVDLSRPDLRESVKEQVLAATDGAGVDIVIDPLGGDPFDGAIRSVAWRGRLVVVGFAAGRIPTLKVNYTLLKNIEVSGLQISDYRRRRPDLMAECYRELFAFYTAGAVKAPPSTALPLSQWRRALTMIAERAAPGRLVLEPRE
ncbi:molybdopterin cofactor-binding domain-containing protein [Streptomyces sp. NPDC003374]